MILALGFLSLVSCTALSRPAVTHTEKKATRCYQVKPIGKPMHRTAFSENHLHENERRQLALSKDHQRFDYFSTRCY